MPSVTNATIRRLRHANGYLGLRMLNEASDELEAIEGEDRPSAEVMAVRADLFIEAKDWELLLAVSGAMLGRSKRNAGSFRLVDQFGGQALAASIRRL
jgi:hypothetical protein